MLVLVLVFIWKPGVKLSHQHQQLILFTCSQVFTPKRDQNSSKFLFVLSSPSSHNRKTTICFSIQTIKRRIWNQFLVVNHSLLDQWSLSVVHLCPSFGASISYYDSSHTKWDKLIPECHSLLFISFSAGSSFSSLFPEWLWQEAIVKKKPKARYILISRIALRI